MRFAIWLSVKQQFVCFWYLVCCFVLRVGEHVVCACVREKTLAWVSYKACLLFCSSIDCPPLAQLRWQALLSSFSNGPSKYRDYLIHFTIVEIHIMPEQPILHRINWDLQLCGGMEGVELGIAFSALVLLLFGYVVFVNSLSIARSLAAREAPILTREVRHTHTHNRLTAHEWLYTCNKRIRISISS